MNPAYNCAEYAACSQGATGSDWFFSILLVVAFFVVVGVIVDWRKRVKAEDARRLAERRARLD